MQKYKVELLPAAWDDLQEIFDYIFVDSTKSAQDTFERILDSLRKLEQFRRYDAWRKKRNFRRLFKYIIARYR